MAVRLCACARALVNFLIEYMPFRRSDTYMAVRLCACARALANFQNQRMPFRRSDTWRGVWSFVQFEMSLIGLAERNYYNSCLRLAASHDCQWFRSFSKMLELSARHAQHFLQKLFLRRIPKRKGYEFKGRKIKCENYRPLAEMMSKPDAMSILAHSYCLARVR